MEDLNLDRLYFFFIINNVLVIFYMLTRGGYPPSRDIGGRR